jgi:hypothetical protein
MIANTARPELESVCDVSTSCPINSVLGKLGTGGPFARFPEPATQSRLRESLFTRTFAAHQPIRGRRLNFVSSLYWLKPWCGYSALSPSMMPRLTVDPLCAHNDPVTLVDNGRYHNVTWLTTCASCAWLFRISGLFEGGGADC